MSGFEHRVISVAAQPHGHWLDLPHEVAEAGEDGWRIVGLTHGDGQLFLAMSRPLPVDEEPTTVTEVFVTSFDS